MKRITIDHIFLFLFFLKNNNAKCGIAMDALNYNLVLTTSNTPIGSESSFILFSWPNHQSTTFNIVAICSAESEFL